jgi:uncharacterized protein YkwD
MDYYRKRAMVRLAIIAVVIVAAGGAVWYVVHSPDALQDIPLLDASKDFSAPAPLIATSTITSAAPAQYTLTRAGVIADTNEQRAGNGNLPPLAENATLDEVATLRLQDMFAKQYFAHISPPDASGATSSAITVAQSLGYSYIALGENLALGNFVGDQGVVTAWMGSPGHRANILDTNYTQIGVAVGDGVFQGQKAWIAVQVFGRPASDCPAPDVSLKATIDAAQAQIATLGSQIQTDKVQIDAAQSEGATNTTAYDQEVSAYNALVGQYNALNTQTQTEIAQYNMEANAYNKCIGVGSSTATSSQ